uniref:Leucine rich repeat containing 23 n=1 Tax=Sphaeramia orbicularis TaxID=375764 RepID=A0A673AVE6_9TELE
MSEVDEDVVMLDVQDETQEEGGEEDKIQVCHLTQETLIQGLSLLCKTGNGLAHAFVKLDLKDKGLTDISEISNYVHLRFLDLSNNRLADLAPLASLTQLLWLKRNTCMAGNLLTDLDGLVGSALESLNVTGNSIQKLNGLQRSCFTNLVSLELRGNQLETTEDINLPNLQRLYLAQNVIKRLEGLERLECLTVLHLRDNQLETLDGLSPNMKCLQYLNVRGNAIIDENAVQSLGFVAKTLRTLVLSENPLVEASDYHISVLMLLPHLERLDKDTITSEERIEAREKLKVNFYFLIIIDNIYDEIYSSWILTPVVLMACNMCLSGT